MKRLFALLFLSLAVLAAAPSSAQTAEMLFLSTAENSAPPNPVLHPDKAWDAFSAQAITAGLTPVDGRGALSDAATPLDFTNTKLVVVLTVYSPVVADRMNELTAALQNRPDLAFVIFSDGCATCNIAQNLQPFLTAVNDIRPASWAAMALGASTNNSYTAILNTVSSYAPTFSSAGLDTFTGGVWSSITGVPLHYALYTETALPSPPPVTVDDVVGLFLPQTTSNNGLGSCVFLTSDATQFSDDPAYADPSQYESIAKAFTAAALDPNGACKQAPAGAPDLYPALSGPTNLIIDVSSPITLTVHNSGETGVTASLDGQVEVILPADIELAGAPPAGCVATATGFTCALPGLTPGESVSFDFRIVARNVVTDVPILAEVTGVTGEINLANNNTQRNVSATQSQPRQNTAQSVPTLTEQALVLLALMLAGLAIRRRVSKV